MPIFGSITFSIVVASLFNWFLVNRVSAKGYVITGITLVMYNIHPSCCWIFAGVIFLAASSGLFKAVIEFRLLIGCRCN